MLAVKKEISFFHREHFGLGAYSIGIVKKLSKKIPLFAFTAHERTRFLYFISTYRSLDCHDVHIIYLYIISMPLSDSVIKTRIQSCTRNVCSIQK